VDGEKILRKGAKQFMWITFALWTGFTFVGYFTPITELAGKIASFSTGPWETFWVLFYGGATYVNAGLHARAGLQVHVPVRALPERDVRPRHADHHLRRARGEPRGARKKGTDHKAKGLGDCVDCTMCVQVCPTGIDIRQGLQYECIACAACIDACDEVMDKVGYPRGLIRYDTQSGLEGKRKRVLRPRTLVYATLLAVLVAGFAVTLSGRNVVGIDVIRDRNALYRERPDGRIENVYNVKILNKDRAAHEFRITASGLPGVEIDYAARRSGSHRVPCRACRCASASRAAALQGGTDVVLSLEATGRPASHGQRQGAFHRAD
jgi:cytochrome c oxidase accessory protein FixG